MTIDEIIEQTSQNRETIEEFRIKLQEYGLIGIHKSLDQRAVETFRKAVEYFEAIEDKETDWSDSVQRAIQEEYGEEMKLPFVWENDILLKNLIWKIKNRRVNVGRANNEIRGTEHSEDFHIIYQIIIDNFEIMGKTIDVYNKCYGTDGNPASTFICKGKDYIYYIVGKYNGLTKQEDVHVFYNDGIEFNLMKCKHICGGYSEKGRLKELLDTCSSFAPEL